MKLRSPRGGMELLQWMANQLMEIEVSTIKTEVEKGKHSGERKTHRNGYCVRRWDTRLGTIYLTVLIVSLCFSLIYLPIWRLNILSTVTKLHSFVDVTGSGGW